MNRSVIEALAEQAGLGDVLRDYPDDVFAAAERAESMAGGFTRASGAVDRHAHNAAPDEKAADDE